MVFVSVRLPSCTLPQFDGHFEAQTIKRLVYFKHAKANPDPVFIQPVTSASVKAFFFQQAKEIGSRPIVKR